MTLTKDTAEAARTIPDIPYGTKYTVEEILSGTDWTKTATVYSNTDADRKLKSASETATVTNANAVSLTLSKAMTKVNGDPTREVRHQDVHVYRYIEQPKCNAR